MMNDASIRPSRRNTFACNCGMSSGWRAAPSRKRLHMMPTPMQAPAAPRPIIRPMPTLVYACTIAMIWSLSICFSFLGTDCDRMEGSVTFVPHRDVDDGKHHEDIGLQHDDQ